MKRILLIFVTALLIFSCSDRDDVLTIGIIKPSINHLPLSYAIHKRYIDPENVRLVEFSSGWELQEAIVANKIDCAIIPFTYAYNAVDKGYPIQIYSFFERRTDGILAQPDLKTLYELDGKKVGMLRASSLEVLFADLSQRLQIKPERVYFRTPNEMIGALQSGEIGAIVAYVPLIQKLTDYKVLHWFNEVYPDHPCCDLAVNTKRSDSRKLKLLQSWMKPLDKAMLDIDNREPELLAFMRELYGLSSQECLDALIHTKFFLGLETSGKKFEQKMMQVAIREGLQERSVDPDTIYMNHEQ